jgi:hypothetical protein
MQASVASRAKKNTAERDIGVDTAVTGVTGVTCGAFVTPSWYYTGVIQRGRLTESTDRPQPDCFYCKGIRGRPEAVDVDRYIRAGVGRFLR